MKRLGMMTLALGAAIAMAGSANAAEVTYESVVLGESYTDLEAEITVFNNRTDLDSEDYGGVTWAEYLEAFNEMYPGITVDITTDTNYADSALTHLQSGDYETVLMIPAVDMADLSTYFMSYGDVDTMSELINYADKWAYDGEVYGVPSTATTQGIVYNKKVFEEAGITELPTTPAEFIEALQAIKDKQCYAHAFVILAAASGMTIDLPGAEELMDQALSEYDRCFWKEEEGLSCDTWNTEFTLCDTYRGLNANMHTVEAFLGAADALKDETYRIRAGRIIRHVAKWAEDNCWRIPEHYQKDWTPDLEYNKEQPEDPFKPYGATPGHGLEWARLIVQWAVSSHLKENNAEEWQYFLKVSEQLYSRAVQDAWNKDGEPGFVYTTDWDGTPVVHERMHWVICEAVNTAACLYRLTGKEMYAENYAEFMAYIDEKVLDHKNGSWFHELDRHNQVSQKVWPGKPDLYHALQATLIPLYGASLSICPAVKESIH